MTEKEEYLHKLTSTLILREELIRRVIASLRIQSGSKGLDAACGEGSLTLMLADAVGSKGHITGIDIEPYFLNYAKMQAAERNLSDRITFDKGNIEDLNFPDNAFDWMWSVDCGCYYYSDHLKVLREFSRVVKPGGFVATMFWSSQMLLPGYPELEARLNATAGGIAPFRTGMNPDKHPFCLTKWFREAGMTEVKVDTSIKTIQAPLSDDMKEALTELIDMRWMNIKDELSKDDWDLFQRLVNPESEEFILNSPDYYGFFTYTIYHGLVA